MCESVGHRDLEMVQVGKERLLEREETLRELSDSTLKSKNNG